MRQTSAGSSKHAPNCSTLTTIHATKHHHTINQANSYYEKLSRGRMFSQPNDALVNAHHLPSLKSNHWLQGSPRIHNRSINTSYNSPRKERSIDSVQKSDRREVKTQSKHRKNSIGATVQHIHDSLH